MARLAYLGAELNDPGPGVEWTARSTTWPTISSSIKRSGGYSVQVTSLVSATPKWLAYQYVAGGGNRRSEAQTQGEWYFDDIAINSSTGSFQNSYPGAGRIVALRPNAAGDSADFARGGTDSGANWSQTDEVTPTVRTS